jgi:diaminopimelate epimerase
MNGAGNKILVADLRDRIWRPDAEWLRGVHREPGLAFDQLMTIEPALRQQAAAFVRIYNNDGSEAQACGNGTRCVADFLFRELGRDAFTVDTRAAEILCERIGASAYRVDMGPPSLAWRDIPTRAEIADTAHAAISIDGAFGGELRDAALVSMGNPHAVFFVSDLDAIAVGAAGPRFETHPMFPEKANISFAEVTGRDTIRLKVWERAVGETLACGSAACATLVSAVRRNLTDRRARVSLPGGDLEIEWRRADDHVLLSGPVAYEFTAVIAEAPGRAASA